MKQLNIDSVYIVTLHPTLTLPQLCDVTIESEDGALLLSPDELLSIGEDTLFYAIAAEIERLQVAYMAQVRAAQRCVA